MSAATAQTGKKVTAKTKMKPKVAPLTKARVSAKSKVTTKQPGVIFMPNKFSAYKKLEASFEPAMEFNKMVSGSMESAYNMMMDSYQGYAKLGIDNLSSSLKIRTPEDMMSYLESQHAMAQKASDLMMSDAKSCSDMSIKFFNDMRSMYESYMKTTVSAATDALKAA